MRSRYVLLAVALSVSGPGCQLVSTAVHNVRAEIRENWEDHKEWARRRREGASNREAAPPLVLGQPAVEGAAPNPLASRWQSQYVEIDAVRRQP
jgi:hypothetical protein